MTKNELRTCFNKARQDFVLSLNFSQITVAIQNVQSRLVDARLLSGTIGGYAAMTSELDPAPMFGIFRDNGHSIALPWFTDRSADMTFKMLDGPLERGPFGISQPSPENDMAEPDTILIPLVAADGYGNRIGQGQGHFDRYLAKSRKKRPIVAIGLAWECQIADQLPADPWDQPLDFIATPDRFIKVTS
ncbi:5-formyltetrahydrofolate cyclo-ligase [Parasphingopyxis lamellibrachiae]|uniref:5-formyltetrahydrofolate cyclo-ligase n=1 Tax=Parasphingopyxis lamellibrachiae TaxID=680125 RepID=A0A3D9FCS4_9SPHN|nr:5-formyltetrahydrofolate cyclo-ligase [Parasphingopyxis lamellibrachiae]RED15347.1 5-formyltetrahydrofolate cyclo-ligase [Parasphingopyxis lamellibrachiae]